MDFEVINVVSVSEHLVIVELKGLPTPLLLKDVCSVPVPAIPTTTAQSNTPSIAGTPTRHTETQQNQKPEQKETPAVFDFEKCLKSGKPSDFECMVKVMDSGSDNLQSQVEACNALAHAQLKPTGIILMFTKSVSTNKEMDGLGRCGIIGCIVRAIQQHIGNGSENETSLCKNACVALGKITAKEGLINEHSQYVYLTLTITDNRVIAGREGAISVVLSVLNKHISSESVCTSACNTLCNITFNDGVFDEQP